MGVKEQIQAMLKRYGELSREVVRLEGVVEEQRVELEKVNLSRMGIYHGFEDEVVVTREMVEEEEEEVRVLEERIKAMNEQVYAC